MEADFQADWSLAGRRAAWGVWVGSEDESLVTDAGPRSSDQRRPAYGHKDPFPEHVGRPFPRLSAGGG